jgi:hypothetical protein
MRHTNLLPDFCFHWNGTLEHLHHLERQKRRFYVSSIAVQEHFWDESPNALCNGYCEPAYSFGDNTPVSTSSKSNRCPLGCLVALLLGLRECERHDEEGEQDWDAISFES